MANIYEVTAIAGQTVFDLPFTYTPGSNDLFAFWNGQLLYVGLQYNETTSTRITLTFPAEAGDEFTFRVPPSSFLGMASPASFSFAPPLPRPTEGLTLLFA